VTQGRRDTTQFQPADQITVKITYTTRRDATLLRIGACKVCTVDLSRSRQAGELQDERVF
jgi:hypothetical protein